MWIGASALLHMFGSCLKLCLLWQSISETLSEIFGKVVVLSPFIAFSGEAQMGFPFEMWEITILAFCSPSSEIDIIEMEGPSTANIQSCTIAHARKCYII